MIKPGRILIADDEETFLEATAELLRVEGFQCDGAPDAATAAEMLKRDQYDLLISDIKMPGNVNLEFVKKVSEMIEGLPVILLTGYPDVDTAAQAVELPILAYLVKPVKTDELVEKVRAGVKQSRAFRAARRIRQNVKAWDDELSDIEDILKVSSPSAASQTPLETFLQTAFRNVVHTFSDLSKLTAGLTGTDETREVCHMINCSRHKALKEALQETIGTLERTKASFKSKTLEALREKLNRVLENEAE